MHGNGSNDNDLKSDREINLLPESLRKIEDKVKQSSGSQERPYQLRAPKKEQQKRSWVWLPWFGRSRWDSTAIETGVPAPEMSEIRDKVRTEEKRSRDEMHGIPDAAATPGDKRWISVSPHVSNASQRESTFSFPGLDFFYRPRKRPVAPLPGILTSNSPVVPRTNTVSESRHYSLLESEQPLNQSPVATQPIEVPLKDTVGYLSAVGVTGIKEPPVAQRRSWRVPRWLDIFYVMSLVIPRKTTTMRTEKKMPQITIKLPHVSAIHRTNDVIKTTHRESSVDQRGTSEPQRPGIVSVLSAGAPGQAQPKRQSWRVPRWLDIFSLLSVFSPKHSTHRVKEKQVVRESLIKLAPLGHEQVPPRVVTPAAILRPVQPTTPVPPIRADASPLKEAPAVTRHPKGLPWWLDIFSLLSIFKPKRRTPRIPKQMPSYADVTRTVTPPLPSRGIPMVSLPKIVIPTPPKIDSISPSVPPAPRPQSVPQPITPRAQPSLDSAIPVAVKKVPVTPVPDEERPPQKEVKHTDRRRMSLHMPKFRGHRKSFLLSARDVNLIPGRYDQFKSGKQIVQIAGAAAAITMGFVIVIAGVLVLWNRQLSARSSEIDIQIAKYSNDIQAYKTYEPAMATLATKIDTIRALMGRHIYWTHFLTLLEKYTLPDVYYDGVTAGTGGTISLSAHGSSYETVTRFLLLLKSNEAKEFVTDASITGATLIEEKGKNPHVDFSVDLTLNPSLFYYAAE